MDVTQVLKFADNLVFTNTGEHLDDLQQAIVQGVCQGKKYSKIAEEFGCSEGHVRDVASELWKIFSEVLGENVSKSNFRSTIERQTLSIISSNFAQDFVGIGNFNLCSDNLKSPEVTTTPSDEESHQEENSIKVRKDLGDAPDISPFYGRTEELTKLEKWIVQERCRLVTFLGISGIGKTALAVKLVEQIQHEFEYMFWRSLAASPPLGIIEKNLRQFLSLYQETELPVPDARLSELFEYLRSYRCLVILDDVHTVFSSGQLAGNYKLGYEDYGELFRRVGELEHNSCFVLLSWDKPREIAALEGESQPVRTLQINGLGEAAREILRDKGLVEDEKWESLINHYRGNPLWLKIVASMIQELFSGRVSELFKYDKLVLNDDLKYILHQQVDRLSELEKEVISAIANEAEPVSISKLLEHIQLSPRELLNAMQSLGRRSLIEKKEVSETLFAVQPVVRQFVNIEYPRNFG